MRAPFLTGKPTTSTAFRTTGGNLNLPEVIPVPPPDPPPDEPPNEAGFPKSWEQVGSFPANWRGSWDGTVVVEKAVFRPHSSFGPDMAAAKKYIVQPGVKGVLYIPPAPYKDIINMYSERVALCREDLDDPLSQTEPGMWVADCQGCAGMLVETLYSMDKARREGDTRDFEWNRNRACSFLESPAFSESTMAHLQAQLQTKQNEMKLAKSAASIDRLKVSNLEWLIHRLKERIASRVAEKRGLELIVAGKDVKLRDDWYKLKGAPMCFI